MMRIAMLVASSVAGLSWCLAASAQQGGDTEIVVEASTHRVVNGVDLLSPPVRLRDGQAAVSSRIWLITPEDKTLQATIAGWSALAGWQLQWDMPVDYPIEMRASISGTFEDAVAVIANTTEKTEVPMKAIFYMGNKVLRIAAKGGE